MASSDNQGLQIALIIFVILTLVLSVTTFLFFRSYEQASLEAQANLERANEFQSANSRTLDANNKLKDFIGLNPGQDIDAVQANYNEDVEKYMSAFPEDKRRYRDALVYMSDVMQQNDTNLAAEIEKVENLNRRIEQAEKDKNQQIQTHQDSAQKSTTDLAQERANFNEFRNQMKRDGEQLLATKQQLQQNLDESTAQAAADIERLTSDLRENNLVKDRLKEQRDQLLDPVFKVADGKIARVNQHTGTVWLTIGRADLLKRQTTFSVYSADAADVADPPSKGKIEVISILDDHLAEARILEDDITDPILMGDLIYTPVWTPGRAERFALAGFMDLDDDTRDDRHIVRNLITRSGGIVDAELNEAGEIEGEMTPDTRFLVLGSQPEGDLAGFSAIQKRAKELGIDEIKLDVFLDHIGFTNPRRVFRFGETPGGQYPVDLPDGFPNVSRGRPSGSFMDRVPRARTTQPEVERDPNEPSSAYDEEVPAEQ